MLKIVHKDSWFIIFAEIIKGYLHFFPTDLENKKKSNPPFLLDPYPKEMK